MARPEAWQLDPASYPISQVCQTRFQDVDPNRHLNNVAFASLFEHARVRLNRELRPWAERPKNERSMVAAVTINYLRKGSYPDDVTVCSGVSTIGKSSYSYHRRCSSMKSASRPVTALSSAALMAKANRCGWRWLMRWKRCVPATRAC